MTEAEKLSIDRATSQVHYGIMNSLILKINEKIKNHADYSEGKQSH